MLSMIFFVVIFVASLLAASAIVFIIGNKLASVIYFKGIPGWRWNSVFYSLMLLAIISFWVAVSFYIPVVFNFIMGV